MNTCSVFTTTTTFTILNTTTLTTTIPPLAQPASFGSSASIAAAIGAVGVLIALVLIVALSRRRRHRNRNKNKVDPVDLREQISFINPTIGEDMFNKIPTKFNPIFTEDNTEETIFNPLYDEPAVLSTKSLEKSKPSPLPNELPSDGNDDDYFDFDTSSPTKATAKQDIKATKGEVAFLSMAVAKFENEAQDPFAVDINQSGYLDVGYDENDDGADDGGDISQSSHFGNPNFK